jgi:hypothetical protein
VAPYVITLSVFERNGLSLPAKRRFSISETPFLFDTAKLLNIWVQKQAFPDFISDLFPDFGNASPKILFQVE